MKTRLLATLGVLALAACQGSESTAPMQVQVPSLAISDGAHSAGNPDFFFLPPIVIPTAALTNWTKNGFNPSLSPSVEICRLAATTAAAVPTTSVAACNGPTTVLSGAQVKKHFPPVTDPNDQLTGLPDDWAHYHATFPIPNNCTTSFFYRVRVKVGATELGYADVQCITSLLQLLTLDYKKFGPALKGTTLQIPFRIERYALCPVPGIGPCGTATIPLSSGGHVEFPGPDGHTLGAVTIPAQLPTAPSVTVTVQPCAGGASLPIDLPKFGGCVTVVTDPAGLELTSAATVEICNLAADLDLSSLTHVQKDRVTLHRQSGASLQALPHVPGCSADAAMIDPSLKGLLGALVHRDWKGVGGQLAGLLGPSPLYARRLDVGAGGSTRFFSDFQFALPAKMQIVLGDGQAATPGTLLPVNPTVLVTDLMGDPVKNATVNFAASAGGTAGAAAVVTGVDGLAAVTWTLSSTPGANSLTASGRGIADPVNNGPRSTFDPFMSIQSAFNPSAETIPSPLQPVDLQTGSVSFGATGTDTPLPYGSGGFRYLLTTQGGGPPDFSGVGFIDTGFSTGSAPFGSIGATAGCQLLGDNPAATNWPLGSNDGGGSDLLLRRTFAAPAGSTLYIFVAIDNDVQVFLNGVDLTTQNGSGPPASGMSGDGLKQHENCAVRPTSLSDPFVFSALGDPSGQNVLAVRARDRGVAGYFDVQVKLVP